MFKKKPEPTILFECENWATRKYSPIRPAAEFIPEKFKNLPTVLHKGEFQKQNVYSVKICPGLQHYIGQGFVIPAWCDIDVKIINDHPHVTYSDPDCNHAYHSKEQMGDFLNTRFSLQTPVKLDNPWIMYTKKGWSTTYLPMLFHENPYFEAVPGSINHDKGPGQTPINIMLKTNKDFVIKQGTPLVQVIPYPRETVVARTGDISKTTSRRYHSLIKTAVLTFKGWRFFMADEKNNYIVDARDTEVPSDLD